MEQIFLYPNGINWCARIFKIEEELWKTPLENLKASVEWRFKKYTKEFKSQKIQESYLRMITAAYRFFVNLYEKQTEMLRKGEDYIVVHTIVSRKEKYEKAVNSFLESDKEISIRRGMYVGQ